MSKHTWITGETITAALLNALESGAAKAEAAGPRTFSPEDFGAPGSGDETPFVQAAYDAARLQGGKRGGTVLLRRMYSVSSPVRFYTSVSTLGTTGTWSLDTANYHSAGLKALPGFAGSAILTLDADGATVPSPPGPDDSWHWASIEKIVVEGTGPTGPHGIDPGWFGEAAVIDQVQAYNCNSGVYLNSVQASGTIRSISAFDCNYGVNCDGINGHVRILGLSGDNNTSLLRVKGGLSAAVTVFGMKAENYDAGTGDPVIDITDLDGGSVTVIGGWCDTDGARNAVVKLSKTGATTNYPRVVLIGLHANALYTNLLNDTILTKTVPRSIAGLGYPVVYYNVPIVSDGQGGHIIGYGTTIQGTGSWGGQVPLVAMETDDSSSFLAASPAGGKLKSSAGVIQLRWNNTGLGFYSTTPIAKPAVSGSRAGNAALASLLTQLAALGLITDSSTA